MALGVTGDPARQYSDYRMLATELRAKGNLEGILSGQNDGYDLQAKALFGLDEAKFDAIIVPGLQIQTFRTLPQNLAFRLDRAVDLFQAGVAPRIVVSGGGHAEDFNESALMKSHLLWNRNIPEEAILVEPKAVESISNLVLSQRLLMEEGINSTPLIVTSSYHYDTMLALGEHTFGEPVQVVSSPLDKETAKMVGVYVHRQALKIQELREAGLLES